MISRRLGLRMLVVVTIAILVVGLMLPRIPQPQSYHAFADQRSFLGVSHFVYGTVQAYSVIFVLLALLFPTPYTHGS